MRMLLRYTLLILALLPAACGSAPGSGAAPTAPLPSAIPSQNTPAPAATPTAVATTAPLPTVAPKPTSAPTQAPTAASTPSSVPAGAAILTYRKSGGIAGIDETLTVYADGKLTLRSRAGTTSAQVEPAALAELRKLLASPELTSLQLGTPPPGADQFVYELTLPGAAQPIVATDSQDLPAILSQVIAELEQLKSQMKPA